MSKYFIFIFCVLLFSCSKHDHIGNKYNFYYNIYTDYFISKSIYYYLDDKKWKEGFGCGNHTLFTMDERADLDTLVMSLRHRLNNYILDRSEGGYSMYLIGPEGKNILEDDLKRNSVSTCVPHYGCVVQACMDVVRTKEFQKKARQFAIRKLKEEKNNRKK